MVDAKFAFQKLLLNLLQRSISCRARQCIEYLLRQLETLDEEDDIHERNCVHRLVISVSRTKANELKAQQQPSQALSVAATQYIIPAESPARIAPPAGTYQRELLLMHQKHDESIQLLIFLLNKLSNQQRAALNARDAYGRIPLHYAAQYGFLTVVEIVIKHMQDWGQFQCQ